MPYDFVLSPAMTDLGFPAEAVGAEEDEHFAHCSYAIPFNQTGAPALVICAGFAEGLPVAVQVAGRNHDDLGTMRFGAALERRLGIDIRWPFR